MSIEQNKNLVKQGHELAVLLGTLNKNPEAASLVQRLATALDVTTLAVREMTKQRDALAAERDAVNADNAYLRDSVLCWARECDRITYTHTNKVTDAHQIEAMQELANTLPATDAFLREVRAQGVDEFAAAQRELANKSCYGYRSDIAGVAAVFANKLRKGGAA